MLFPGVVHTFLLSRGGELTHVHHLSLSSIISRCSTAADLLFKHGWITKLVAKRFSFFYILKIFYKCCWLWKAFKGVFDFATAFFYSFFEYFLVFRQYHLTLIVNNSRERCHTFFCASFPFSFKVLRPFCFRAETDIFSSCLTSISLRRLTTTLSWAHHDTLAIVFWTSSLS